MKWRFLIVALLSSYGACNLQAQQAPDAEYIAIYNLIHEADQLSNTGQSTVARAKFVEAQTALKQLQSNYPNWNEKVVRFRLNYLAERLGTPVLEKPAAPLAPAIKAPSSVESAPPAIDPRDAQIQTLQEELQRSRDHIRQLESDRAILTAKLNEALTAQPAAIDPRELAKAESRIQALEKEKEVLKVSLDQEIAKRDTDVDSKVVEQLKQALAASNGKLQQQIDVINTLTREKQILEGRLSAGAKDGDETQKLRAENIALRQEVERTTSANSQKIGQLEKEVGSVRDELKTKTAEVARLETRVKELQDANRLADIEKRSLEARLAAPSGSKDAERIRELEAEREGLLKKLNEATESGSRSRQRRGSAEVVKLNQRISELEARLQTFEARKLPYTPEELALFKAPAVAVASAPEVAKAAPKKTVAKTPPRSAGPLIADAERAFSERRFDEAEKKYQEVLKLDDKNVLTLANLAASQVEQSRFTEAEVNLRKALELDDENAHCLSLLGILKFRQEKYDEALDALSRSAQLDAKNPETQNYLGITLSQKGQRGPAEAALRKAVELAPGYGGAHHNLAVVYATQQPPFIELARWHYQKALAAGHPRNPELERTMEARSASTK